MPTSIKNILKKGNTLKSKNNLRKYSITLQSKNNRQQKAGCSRSRKIRGGNHNLIHILYVLGTKNQPYQLQVIAMSKSIKNLHMFAKDLPKNLLYRDTKNQSILKSSMAIDTIELDNPNTSHNWQNVNLQDVDRLIYNGDYDGSIEDIAEVLYYTFDKSSPITGVVGAVYSTNVSGSDGQMMTELNINFSKALSLLRFYDPIDFTVNVTDHNISLHKVKSEEVERFQIHILYVLGTKNQPYQLQVVAMSKSIKNLHMFAKDLPSKLSYPPSAYNYSFYRDPKTGYEVQNRYNKNQDILMTNMAIDTIELNNSNTSHNWQYVNLQDVDRLIKNGDYDKRDYFEIDEKGYSRFGRGLYYRLDKSSPITGVVGSVYTVDWWINNTSRYDDRDGEMRTDFGNFDNAISLLKNYDPIDLTVNVTEHNVSLEAAKPNQKIDATQSALTDHNVYLEEWKSAQKIDATQSASKLSELQLDNNTKKLVSQGKISMAQLKDLILQYRDRIPELLKEFTPEYLFQTGLFSYGDLKPYIKEQYSKQYLELTKDCKKNWKRQTNLDCKFIPDTFPKYFTTAYISGNKGRVVNETERYPQKE